MDTKNNENIRKSASSIDITENCKNFGNKKLILISPCDEMKSKFSYCFIQHNERVTVPPKRNLKILTIFQVDFFFSKFTQNLTKKVEINIEKLSKAR